MKNLFSNRMFLNIFRFNVDSSEAEDFEDLFDNVLKKEEVRLIAVLNIK